MKIFLDNVEQKLDFPLTLVAPAPYTFMIKDSDGKEFDAWNLKTIFITESEIHMWDLWSYEEFIIDNKFEASDVIYLESDQKDIYITTHKYVGKYDKPIPKNGRLITYTEFKNKLQGYEIIDYHKYSNCLLVHNGYATHFGVESIIENDFDESFIYIGAEPTHIFIPDNITFDVTLPYELRCASYSSITNNDEFNEDFYWVIPKELSKRSHILAKYIKSSNVFKTFDQTELQIDDILAVKFVEYP